MRDEFTSVLNRRNLEELARFVHSVSALALFWYYISDRATRLEVILSSTLRFGTESVYAHAVSCLLGYSRRLFLGENLFLVPNWRLACIAAVDHLLNIKRVVCGQALTLLKNENIFIYYFILKLP